ncbi:MAG: carbohydrate ABC transporter permease [Pseudoclavibacter sp.]
MRRRPQRKLASKGFVVALLVLITLTMMFPFYWMLVTALTPEGQATSTEFRLWPSEPTLDNFVLAFTTQPLWTWIGNSMLISTIGAALSIVVSLLAGYAFAKFRFRGRTVIFMAYLLTIMIPIQVTLVPAFLVVVNLGLVNTIWGVILPGLAEATGIFIARQFMMSIPDEIIEAARLDGASELRIFLKIVLPLSGPLIGVLAILTFLARWNEFLWPFVVLQGEEMQTLPMGLASLQGGDLFSTPWGMVLAVCTIAVLPVLVLFLIFQKQFVQGISSTGLK